MDPDAWRGQLDAAAAKVRGLTYPRIGHDLRLRELYPDYVTFVDDIMGVVQCIQAGVDVPPYPNHSRPSQLLESLDTIAQDTREPGRSEALRLRAFLDEVVPVYSLLQQWLPVGFPAGRPPL